MAASHDSKAVHELAEAQRQVYRASPSEMISHYERERTVTNAYRGRQLLELIQNADDAAKDYIGFPTLLIRLKDDCLVVANSGNPFTRDGIESLVITDNSPKRLRRARLIGNKGLGFRSILSWSRSPLVISGEHAIAFSPEHARSEALCLANQIPSLRTKLDNWASSGNAMPIPLLRFPLVPSPDDERAVLAVQVLKEGYDTAIVLPLNTGPRIDEVRTEIKAQLNAISGRTLLFCYNLRKLVVDLGESNAWDIDRGDGEDFAVKVTFKNTPTAWRIRRRSGKLPDTLVSQEIRNTPEYEVAVAVCDEPIARHEQCLNVFFPTDCRLPMEICAHASLETDESRKHLVKHPANKFVLAKLAELVAEVAEAETSKSNATRGLALIDGLDKCDSELIDLGFRHELLAACNSRNLIVCNDGETRPPSETKAAPNSVWDQFSSYSEFATVAASDYSAKDLRTLLQSLNVGWWTSGNLAEKIAKCLASCDPNTSGRLLRQLIDAGQLPSPPPAILRTAEGDVAPTSQVAFLPSDSPSVPLPSWAAKFFFLNKEFVKGLEAGSGTPRGRNLRDLLRQAGYKADEYSTEAIARHLIEAADEKIAAEPVQAASVTRDVLRCLYSLLSAADSFVIIRTPCNVITTNGTSRPATECYLGPDYPQGAIVSALYSPLGTDELVGSPEALGLNGIATRREIGRFLTQIGVAEEPREQFQGNGLESFVDHVLERLSYPNKLFRFEARSAEDVRKRLDRRKINGLKLPDRFAKVLAKAPPEAIVAYLQSSGNRFIRTEISDFAYFEARGSGERKSWPYPSVPIPNPVLHLLRTVPWVPIGPNNKKTPEQISLSKGASKAFSGTFFTHSIDPDSQLLQRVGGRRAVESLLVRIGAISGLDNLPGEDLYRLLLDLPKRDPEGRNATSIYRSILEAGGTDTQTPLHDEFLIRGMMWGVQGGKGSYFSVRTLRILAGRILPPAVKRLIPLLEVGSAHKIREITRVFGVKAVDASEVTYKVDHGSTRFCEWSATLNAHVREVIPYLYALRLHRHNDSSGRERTKLSEVQIHACESVLLDLTLNGDEKHQLTLTANDNGIVVGSGLYLTSESSEFPQGDMAFWLSVGALFSDLLGVDVTAGFATLLFCETPQAMFRVLNQHTERRGEELIATSKEFFSLRPDEENGTILLQNAVADMGASESESAISNEGANESSGGAPEQSNASAIVETVEPASIEMQTSSTIGSRDEVPQTTFPINDAPQTDISCESSITNGDERSPLSPDISQPPNTNAPSGGLDFLTTAAPTSVSRGSRQLVITRAARPSTGGIVISTVANEFTSLEIVKDFETKQGRFPIDVSHLHGEATFGCDIVSVATEQDRSQAIISKSIDVSRVVRFIEVKGRSSRRGTIELEPNQLSTAKKRRAKFFIYRVFHDQQRDGYFEVAILSDPVHSKGAIERKSVVFDLGSASGAEWFRVEPHTPSPAGPLENGPESTTKAADCETVKQVSGIQKLE